MRRAALLFAILSACHASSAPTDAGPAEWPLFPGNGYELRMPGLPAVSPPQRAESDTAGLVMQAATYLAPDKSLQLGIVTFDFPTVSGPIAFGSPVYLAVHGRVLKGLNAKVLNDVAGTWYALPGHQAELERPGANGTPVARIVSRLVVKDRRLYFLSAIREAGASEKDSLRFLDSFRLTGP